MSTKTDLHLTEAQILRATVDEADLPSEVREHLARCGPCLEAKERIEARLARMTQMARQLTPPAGRRPSLAPLESRSPGWRAWGWGYGLSAGLVAAVVVIIAVGSLWVRSSREDTAYLADRETMEDEQFMAEVARLEQNGFPPLYLEMTGGDEADAGEKPGDDESMKGTQLDQNHGPSDETGKVS